MNNNLFEELSEKSDTVGSLDMFLNENMQTINEFYNSNYVDILPSKKSIDNFILLRSSIISQLDFSKSYTKSFALMLLDFCERFNFIASTPRIYKILERQSIAVNSRLQAALQFLYPKPETNSELVDKFDSICEKLQLAIDSEEDNDNKSIATFLNYYGIIVNDTSLQFAEQVKQKMLDAIKKQRYSFLQNENISTIAKIELNDLPETYRQVQSVIDKVLGRENIDICIPDEKTERLGYDYIIEMGTDYSRQLLSVPTNFDSIRAISLGRAGSEKISGRGVKMIESEEELFGYFKSFGNMHKAKLLSAFEALPNTFASKVNVIDWGCGQGFASMLFLEKYGNVNIPHITLIEPSDMAVKRAALHCRKYCPNILLKTICKKLDELDEDDFINIPQSTITVHLFSNILDIDDYSQRHLMELIEKTQSGENYFVCVSPHIDAIKTERLETFKRHFEHRRSFNLLLDIINTKSPNNNFWCCNNTFKKYTCTKHSKNGCNRKWTRIIIVFKINLE